jgi:chemotaxis protein histidine kinase CheA
LRDAYAIELPQKLEQIERRGMNCRIKWDDEGFQSLYRMVHSLSGSGRTFGFALLSAKARSLEETLQLLVHAKAIPSAEQRIGIQALLNELLQIPKK